MAGANGYVIFCSTQIIGHKDVQDMLLAGVNSTAAVRPHDTLDKVLDGYFAAILDRAQRLYMPANGMTQEQYDQLQAKFNEIKAMPQDGAVNIYKIQKAVQGMYSITGTSYAKGYSSQRIVETLKELVSLLDTRISLALIQNGDWDPEKNPARPTVTEEGIKEPEPSKPSAPVNPDPTKPTTPANKNDDAENQQFFNMLWVILAIALVVMLLSGGMIVWMAKRKKNGEEE